MPEMCGWHWGAQEWLQAGEALLGAHATQWAPKAFQHGKGS